MTFHADDLCTLYLGDCVEVMAGMAPESIDAIVPDPPYNLGFMGKAWDSKHQHEAWAREAFRVAKPGAHLLAFGGTRTYHRLASAIEDAGWEIRDCLVWVYASGFPKSLDVSKAIDKAAGVDREQGPPSQWAHVMGETPKDETTQVYGRGQTDRRTDDPPATPDAQKWDGWGTALKPAWEPIVLARKPLRGTVAANVLAHGTGALNIDATRIAGASGDGHWNHKRQTTGASWNHGSQPGQDFGNTNPAAGRWPANLILTDPIFDGDTPGVVGGGTVLAGTAVRAKGGVGAVHGIYGAGMGAYPKGSPDVTYNDSGTYSRFFLIPKSSRSDREPLVRGATTPVDAKLGLAHGGPGEPGKGTKEGYEYHPSPRQNAHPTVKPIDLMRHLVRLVTPPGGTVLDPFLGSGTTAIAANAEGFRCIGIEREREYLDIALARMAHQPLGLAL